MLGSGLMSTRDMQLKCLIKLNREISKRDENNELRQTEELITRIYLSQSLLNKIKMQQRYLKNNDVLKIIQDKDKNEVDT